ncbi:MAG TPA: FHA domain-containing protein [Ktedonobacterales bacterium]|nr:FHA domain-containing protein [Ktedonobacterales bacterium]
MSIDYYQLLFLRIALVAVLYLVVLQIVFVARREMRMEAKAATQGTPTRARQVVGHLVVVDKGSTQLNDGDAYDIEAITTLGRELTNSVPIDSDFVSGAHARILYDEADGALWVEDLGSRNGTYVDGRKLNERDRVQIDTGSLLQIGDARFKVDIARAVVGYLRVLDRGSTQLQNGARYPIYRVLTIGRGPANNIPLESPRVSAAHARITFEPRDSTLWVQDLESRNGTFVDGRKIATPVAVSPGSELLIGDTRFQFLPPDMK